jgi:chromosome condensin MukBEF complex kleisin-like MukF subunit
MGYLVGWQKFLPPSTRLERRSKNQSSLSIHSKRSIFLMCCALLEKDTLLEHSLEKELYDIHRRRDTIDIQMES